MGTMQLEKRKEKKREKKEKKRGEKKEKKKGKVSYFTNLEPSKIPQDPKKFIRISSKERRRRN